MVCGGRQRAERFEFTGFHSVAQQIDPPGQVHGVVADPIRRGGCRETGHPFCHAFIEIRQKTGLEYLAITRLESGFDVFAFRQPQSGDPPLGVLHLYPAHGLAETVQGQHVGGQLSLQHGWRGELAGHVPKVFRFLTKEKLNSPQRATMTATQAVNPMLLVSPAPLQWFSGWGQTSPGPPGECVRKNRAGKVPGWFPAGRPFHRSIPWH
jgi:hypothetical protein